MNKTDTTAKDCMRRYIFRKALVDLLSGQQSRISHAHKLALVFWGYAERHYGSGQLRFRPTMKALRFREKLEADGSFVKKPREKVKRIGVRWHWKGDQDEARI
jgi:hypothetical protein